jgi:hypothetical protein
MRALQPALSPEGFDAYDLYLKGRYVWNKRTLQGFEQAANYFQQSIAKQASYARAYAGLADTFALMSNYGFATRGPPGEGGLSSLRICRTRSLYSTGPTCSSLSTAA